MSVRFPEHLTQVWETMGKPPYSLAHLQLKCVASPAKMQSLRLTESEPAFLTSAPRNPWALSSLRNRWSKGQPNTSAPVGDSRLAHETNSHNCESNQRAFTRWPHISSMKRQDNPTGRYFRSMTHICHPSLQKSLKSIFFFSFLTYRGQTWPAMTILMYCP